MVRLWVGMWCTMDGLSTRSRRRERVSTTSSLIVGSGLYICMNQLFMHHTPIQHSELYEKWCLLNVCNLSYEKLYIEKSKLLSKSRLKIKTRPLLSCVLAKSCGKDIIHKCDAFRSLMYTYRSNRCVSTLAFFFVS